MSTTSNKRVKLDHESSTASNQTILQHLVLDGTTERTNTTITEGEYSGSKTLETVRILQGSNIRHIGEEAFFNCKSLRSIHIGDGVINIGEQAFENCSSLLSIHIPDTVTTIGRKAFNGCKSLQSIHIPNSVTTIQPATFWNCYSLQLIHIPDSVTAIGGWAFRNCELLRSIVIPDSVTTIEWGAFNNCTKLQQRQVDHPNYHEDTIAWLQQRFDNLPIHRACYYFGYNNTSSSSSLDNLCTLTQENKEALTTTDANGTTPLRILSCNPHVSAEMMTQIITSNENILRHLVLDSEIGTRNNHTITKGEYSDSLTLETIEILQSSNIKQIGNDAFRDCTSLQSVQIAEDTVTDIGKSAFESCLSLESIRLPNDLTSIGVRAFRRCISLPSIDLPDSLTTISDFAFYNCSSLKSIYMPNDLTSIGKRAFQDCTSLQSIQITSDTFTTIGEACFSGCSSLKVISIPDGITTIERSTFGYCSSLQFIHIPNSVTSIKRYSFEDCSSLQSIRIPNGVTTIGKFAFWKCTSLQSIHIPNSVTTIAGSTFKDCSSLQLISIPDGVTRIEGSAFEDCTSLQTIHIPDSVIFIGRTAFRGCKSLRSILIPETVQIEDDEYGGNESDAFDRCYTLQKRQMNHPTYDHLATTWLRQRFNNLPIHYANYHFGYNNTSSSSLDNLFTLIRENKQALTTTDAMGMTSLNILCCNPHATAEIMQIIVEAKPFLFSHTDVTGCTPLQVFLMCRNLIETNQPIPSLQDLLEKGIKGEDLAILSVLGSNGEIDLSSPDERTGLSPFMSAAVTTACGLDAVYILATRNIDHVI